MSNERATIRRGVVSSDEVMVQVPMPDWDAATELGVITQLVREKTRFFAGRAQVKPLFLDKREGKWKARYRVNFYKPGENGVNEKYLASVYVYVAWLDCSATTPGKACWEPEVTNHVLEDFGKRTPFKKAV